MSVSKIAVVVNTDSDAVSLRRMEQGIASLETNGFETFSMSPEEPLSPVNAFAEIGTDEAARLIEDIQHVSDDQTELAIYIMGNGDLSDIIGHSLDKIPYAKRVVITNQQYPHWSQWTKYFMDDPKNLFVSPDGYYDDTCSDKFSGEFWRVASFDSWGDRIAQSGLWSYDCPRLRILPTSDFPFYSTPPFPKVPLEVKNGADLNEKLKMLKHGQYAIIDLSSISCPSCAEYELIFATLAAKAGGQSLFLSSLSEEMAEAVFGVRVFPLVFVIDQNGFYFNIRDKDHAPDEVADAQLPPYQHMAKLRRRFLFDTPQDGRAFEKTCESALYTYAYLSEGLSEGEAVTETMELRKWFNSKHPLMRHYSFYAFSVLAPKLPKEVAVSTGPELTQHFNDENYEVQVDSLISYIGIARHITGRDALKTANLLLSMHSGVDWQIPIRSKGGWQMKAFAALSPNLPPKMVIAGANEIIKVIKKGHVLANEAFGEMAGLLPVGILNDGARALAGKLHPERGYGYDWYGCQETSAAEALGKIAEVLPVYMLGPIQKALSSCLTCEDYSMREAAQKSLAIVERRKHTVAH